MRVHEFPHAMGGAGTARRDGVIAGRDRTEWRKGEEVGVDSGRDREVEGWFVGDEEQAERKLRTGGWDDGRRADPGVRIRVRLGN